LEKISKKNPKRNEALVKAKREEIQDFLEKWLDEIQSGKVTVFFVDECHLLWGDVCGYVWGKTDCRVEIPIINERERQTYFGALNYQTNEFVVKPYDTANAEKTKNFVEYLRSICPSEKVVLIWDGASYHRGKEFQEYLKSVNQNLSEDEWLVTCLRFAPNAPEQNPVEDVWLQAKRFIREFYCFCSSFSAVKALFELVSHHQFFDFPKLHLYDPISQMI
jgi:transposase